MTEIEWQSINWADYAIIGIVTLSALISFIRGFVREAVSLATWILALWVAFSFAPSLAELLTTHIENPTVRLIVSFSGLFVVTLILGAVANYIISQLVTRTGLSGTDRLVGIVFGLARGALLIGILLLLVNISADKTKPEWLTNSQLAPHFQNLSDWLRGFLPEQFQTISNNFIEQQQQQQTTTIE